MSTHWTVIRQITGCASWNRINIIVADSETHPSSKYPLRLLQRRVWTRVAAFIWHLCNISSPGSLVCSVFHMLTLHSFFPPPCLLHPVFIFFLPIICPSFPLVSTSFLISFPYILAGLQGEVLRDAAERDGSPEVVPGQRGTYAGSSRQIIRRGLSKLRLGVLDFRII